MSAPTPDQSTRPTPVLDEFTTIPVAVRYLATILVGVGAFGGAWLLTGDGVTALVGLALALPALIGDVLRQVRQWRAVAAATAQVTPTSSPAVVVGGELVPLEPARGRHALRDE